MSASTLVRSLPESAAWLWRALGWRWRVAIASLAISLAIFSGFVLREPPDDWPGRRLIELPPRNYPLMFSPDGRTLLTTCQTDLSPWDLGNGQRGARWGKSRPGVFVTRGAFAPDGRTFAAAMFRHPQLATFELIDVPTGQSKATLDAPHPIVYDLAFADDGRTLRAFLGDSGSLKEVVTWDVATGQPTSTRPLTAPTRGCSTAFSPDGRWLAFTTTGAKAVQLWDLETNEALGSLVNPALAGALIGEGFDFAPDGQTLAVGRSDGAIDLWDIPARKLRKTVPAHPRGYASRKIRFAPDGRTLCSLGGDAGSNSAIAQAVENLKRQVLGSNGGGRSEIIVVDLVNGQRIGPISSVFFPLYTPDSQAIATCDEDFVIRLRNLADAPK